MEKDAPDFGIQISTDCVPARERLSYFREALGRSFTRLDLGPYDDRSVRYEATVHGFDGLGVIWGRTNGNIGRRTQPLLTDGNDDFIFGTILSGCKPVEMPCPVWVIRRSHGSQRARPLCVPTTEINQTSPWGDPGPPMSPNVGVVP